MYPVRGKRKYFAHTLDGLGPEHWEELPAHLEAVAELAESFAAHLKTSGAGPGSWGRAAGIWHDLGKYADGFQAKLYAANGLEANLEQHANQVNHSAAGAQHAKEHAGRFARLLAYVIAGHHTGLSDTSRLGSRLEEDTGGWLSNSDPSLLELPDLPTPPVSLEHRDRVRGGFQFAFFTRMLFSCLVDADRLATESFCDPKKYAQRVQPPSVCDLKPRLDYHLARVTANAEPSEVNRARQGVLANCRSQASSAPGFFSLTVPTGGGKTLASLAFALDHAQAHGHRRVVMAIPFTSIIEQTAAVYREVFQDIGDGAVLEHHSSVDPDADHETYRNRLACENWDAPLIATTNVQLFETLFANRTSTCRKLHSLAGSVLILDEAQTLPVNLLKPCLWALRELVTDYGCTVVLCTATQPALEKRDDFSIGLEGVREIIDEPEKLHVAMRRAELNNLGTLDDDALVERLSAQSCWLTIVNTRGHASGLYRQLAEETDPVGLFHLSTHLCAEHRSEKLKMIKQRLRKSEQVRVISTQLVEAGVDIDFPVVFRAMAGVDSIAQAAGRCNREGLLPRLGRVWLFDPADVRPHGYLGATAATTRELLPDYPDLLDPSAVRRYFELHYWKQEGDNRWDDNRVLECFPEEAGGLAYNFKTAAERFRLIEEQSQPVFIPHGRGEQLIDELRRKGPSQQLLRKLQRFTVGLRERECQALVAVGDIEILPEGFYVLENLDLYDDNLGLLVERPGFRNAGSLVT